MADGMPLAPLSTRVRDLERVARRLDPRTEQLESMWSAVGGNVLHAASHRGDQPAYAAAAPDVIPPFTIDEEPTGIDEALSALEAVNATGINQASGGHFAFIPGGGVFPAPLGDLVADVGNAYDGIADVADEHELWLHVDAAYGGFFILVEHGRRLLSGIGRSQSAVLDPHKGLFLPFGSGALVVRDEKQLAQAHRYSATYLADARASGSFSASDVSVELSRPFRGPRLWLPLKLYGL